MTNGSIWRRLGPGLLVAATGVGAGDLATAAFTGRRLGVAVLWAVLVGAGMKYVLTEGLARHQLVTGHTVVEAALRRCGRWTGGIFLVYLTLWSWCVGAALVSACGAAGHALLPLFRDARTGQIAFGVAHAALGGGLVLLGGYRLFERSMKVCIGTMFVAVVAAAVALWPGTSSVLAGLVPTWSTVEGPSLSWTVALLGGIGGTVTILCYGYWLREEGRCGVAEIPGSRLDLAVGYGVTAIFGLAMVIIGSRIEGTGRGARLILTLADRLEEPMGRTGRWVFLAGAWGAVFSSLLGVWQAVPYLFLDVTARLRDPSVGRPPPSASSRAYRGVVLGMSTIPVVGLLVEFETIQRIYAQVGAGFLPALALLLLVLDRPAVLGTSGDRWTTRLALVLICGFFAWAGFTGLLQD